MFGRRSWIWGGGLALALFGACGGDSSQAGGSAGSGSVQGSATFSRVWTEVLVAKTCNSDYCHGAGTGGLSMKDKASAYANLVGVSAAGPRCGGSGKLRVVANDPDHSLLLDKISHAMPACGDAMPLGVRFDPDCLVPDNPAVCTKQSEIDLVRAWIAAGAKDD
jgi:hypothetical protein